MKILKSIKIFLKETFLVNTGWVKIGEREVPRWAAKTLNRRYDRAPRKYNVSVRTKGNTFRYKLDVYPGLVQGNTNYVYSRKLRRRIWAK